VVWLLVGAKANVESDGVVGVVGVASRSMTTVMVATVFLLSGPRTVMVVTIMVVEMKDWVRAISQNSNTVSNTPSPKYETSAVSTSRSFSCKHAVHNRYTF
jgi:hypothetical protein